MDYINLALLGVAIAAAVGWYLWTIGSAKPNVTGTLKEDVRAKARPLLPHADPAASKGQFLLQNAPLLIVPTKRFLDNFTSTPGLSSFDPSITDALWVRQRAFLERIEGELGTVQQCDHTDHYAVAASVNQPADFTSAVSRDAEASFNAMRDALDLKDPLRLWFGRALVVIVANRAQFDHIAWLTDTPMSLSAGNAYVLAHDGVLLIPIYTTRAADWRPLVLRQFAKAVLESYAGRFRPCPRWLEEGFAELLQRSLPRPPVAADEGGPAATKQPPQPAPPSAIIDPKTWDADKDDPAKLAGLTQTSQRAVEWLLARHREQLIHFLQTYKTAAKPDENAAWRAAMNVDAPALMQAFATDNAVA